MKPIVEFKDWTPEPEVNELLEAELDRIQRLVRGLRTVHDAFAEIRRQVEKYRRKLNHTFEYKRRSRRDRLRRLRAGIESAKRRRQISER
jgi:hypothetical protein